MPAKLAIFFPMLFLPTFVLADYVCINYVYMEDCKIKHCPGIGKPQTPCRGDAICETIEFHVEHTPEETEFYQQKDEFRRLQIKPYLQACRAQEELSN